MTAAGASRARFERLDAWRGVAMLWMAAYHFAFDLNLYRFIRADFYRDPLWTWQRTAILSLFLFAAGASAAVAAAQGQTWPRFWRRWAQIAGCALLVSIGSAWMFPRSWIWFGVLHGIALMLVLARLALPLGAWLAPLGAAAIAAPRVLATPALNDTAWLWLGLGTRLPRTEDWVPLLPWLGVVLLGAAAAQALLVRAPGVLAGAVPAAARPLVWLGRHSLAFYMLHQPVLIGLVAAAAWLVRR